MAAILDIAVRLRTSNKNVAYSGQNDRQVSDAFMQKVVNELDPNSSGDPVARFVKINNEMHEQTIRIYG